MLSYLASGTLSNGQLKMQKWGYRLHCWNGYSKFWLPLDTFILLNQDHIDKCSTERYFFRFVSTCAAVKVEFPFASCFDMFDEFCLWYIHVHSGYMYQTLLPSFPEFRNSQVPGVRHFRPLTNMLPNIPGIPEYAGAGYITLGLLSFKLRPSIAHSF